MVLKVGREYEAADRVGMGLKCKVCGGVYPIEIIVCRTFNNFIFCGIYKFCKVFLEDMVLSIIGPVCLLKYT